MVYLVVSNDGEIWAAYSNKEAAQGHVDMWNKTEGNHFFVQTVPVWDETNPVDYQESLPPTLTRK